MNSVSRISSFELTLKLQWLIVDVELHLVYTFPPNRHINSVTKYCVGSLTLFTFFLDLCDGTNTGSWKRNTNYCFSAKKFIKGVDFERLIAIVDKQRQFQQIT